MVDRESLIVAIDGPSGVGKSTVARMVAEGLGIPYLSTGAMYRAIALEVLDAGIDPEDRKAVERLAASADVALEVAGTEMVVLLRGEDPGARAYSLEVSQVTSKISRYKGVRRVLVELQRHGARRHGAVLEGRDIGTRVFPETPDKFFLDASPEVRAERRWLQLPEAARAGMDRSAVLREVVGRDHRDTTRAESPLTRDASYCLIETDNLTAPEVAALIIRRVRDRQSAAVGEFAAEQEE